MLPVLRQFLKHSHATAEAVQPRKLMRRELPGQHTSQVCDGRALGSSPLISRSCTHVHIHTPTLSFHGAHNEGPGPSRRPNRVKTRFEHVQAPQPRRVCHTEKAMEAWHSQRRQKHDKTKKNLEATQTFANRHQWQIKHNPVRSCWTPKIEPQAKTAEHPQNSNLARKPHAPGLHSTESAHIATNTGPPSLVTPGGVRGVCMDFETRHERRGACVPQQLVCL